MLQILCRKLKKNKDSTGRLVQLRNDAIHVEMADVSSSSHPTASNRHGLRSTGDEVSAAEYLLDIRQFQVLAQICFGDFRHVRGVGCLTSRPGLAP